MQLMGDPAAVQMQLTLANHQGGILTLIFLFGSEPSRKLDVARA